jgi:uncharacterized membrane-anchored protein
MPEDVPSNSAELIPHPLRAAALREVHARPFQPLTAPRRLLHYGFMTDGQEALAARAALAEYCHDRGVEPPRPGIKHHRVVLGGAILRWEAHAEFATYTWELLSPRHSAFEPPAESLERVMHGLPQPGPHLVSIDLHLLPDDPDLVLENMFDPASLAASSVDKGAAIAATDFCVGPGGFVRVLVCDCGLTPARAGALVQRLLEIETYRTLALLGLPEAQRLAPEVQRIETQLTRIAGAMTETSGLTGDVHLLNELTGLAAELEAQASASNFRFSASRAYDGIVQQRLDAIGESPLSGWPSLAAFLSRRMAPAMRTSQMLEARQVELSSKLGRAANLLRTRVDVENERQNRDLLQQTVEGLSVAAISYYIVGLMSYIFKGLKDAGLMAVDPGLASAAMVPLALLAVALVVRRIRKMHADRHQS